MKKNRQFIVFLSIAITYVIFVMLGPTDLAALHKYRLTQTQAHLVNLSVVIPFFLIWLTAYFSFSAFRNFAVIVKETPEGTPFKKLAQGLMVLAFSLPINSLTNCILSFIVLKHPSYASAATILRNYTTLLLSLIAFTYLSIAAEGLSRLVKKKPKAITNPKVWPLGIIILSCFFTWIVIARPIAGNQANIVYAMPNWLIITTLAIPYVYAWYRGLLAAYYINFYLKYVKGYIYRNALRFLAAGITVVIILNILIQLFITLSPKLNRLNLTPFLMIIYVLIAMYSLGFGLIAAGAKKLKKIEEV